jgi:undecaprenyl-diphosphatase
MLLAATQSQAAIYHMTIWQAIVIGLIQGVFELFPLSSLGHTVLIPSWLGGNWALLVKQESLAESPYLAFIVGLHLANAVALLLFFLREWGRLIVGFVRTVIRRRIETDTERLAWLIVLATIPVGILGLVLEHPFRVLFAKPVAAAFFLCLNGVILAFGEYHRRRHQNQAAATAAADPVPAAAPAEASDPADGQGPGRLVARRNEYFVSLDPKDEKDLVVQVSVPSAIVIGASQGLALLAGISREGVTMVGGLYRGLSNEAALRFAFLLSTPVIFAAGALKVPDLTGSLGKDIHGQIIAGSIAAVVGSFLSIIFLTRYFRHRTLVPFAVYSLVFGLISLIRFGLF